MNSVARSILVAVACHGSPYRSSPSSAAVGFAYPPRSPRVRPGPTPSLHLDGSFRATHRDILRPMRMRPLPRGEPGNRHRRARPDDGSRRMRLNAAGSDSNALDEPLELEREYVWDVYVSQPSKKNKEKEFVSTSFLMQAFASLAPSPDAVRVRPATFQKEAKQKGRGPTVRCFRRRRGEVGDDGEILSALEIANVDSLDKVYRIISEHMKLTRVDPRAFECMKCYFEGDQNLKQGEPARAIASYDKALSVANQQESLRLPKGFILMNRARAYLKRAAKHRAILRMHVEDLIDTVPSSSTLKVLYQSVSAHPALASTVFDRLSGDSEVQRAKFRQVRYRDDMYEFALLHAVRDGLRATRILPRDARAWILAGECLAELRKLKESDQYCLRALEIDPGVEPMARVVMEKNRLNREFMDAARASGFSGDTLRLALDVAA
ncbi:hypothetical protein ACHAWF_008577 [Thalassiosira exigua]